MSDHDSAPLIDLSSDPLTIFDAWLHAAEKTEPNDPNAMYLATSTPQGRPSLRAILLKGHDRRGFVFYTNLESRKGRELAVNPYAALLFHWKSLRRQIRIEGHVSAVSAAEADRYFASRRRESRIGAIASDQSRPLTDRAIYEKRIQDAEARYAATEPPRPDNWSGFRVNPALMEFWQDRDFRMHDRAVWTRSTPQDETWSVTRLYP